MEETEYLLPSEIARLVYGQLIRMNCNEIAEEFLNTSPHMKECVELRQRKRSFSTRAHNRTLDEIFNEFINVNELLLNTVNDETLNIGRKFHDPVEALKFILTEIESSNTDTDIRSTRNCKERSKSITSDEETFSDICLKIRSSPELVNARISHQSSLLDSLYNSNNNITENNGFESNSENRNSTMVNNPKNYISHGSISKNTNANTQRKVKILPPRKTLPVIGKKIPRSFENPQRSIELEHAERMFSNKNCIGSEVDDSAFNEKPRHCKDNNPSNSALTCTMDCASVSRSVMSESLESTPTSITSVLNSHQTKSTFERIEQNVYKTNLSNLPRPLYFNDGHCVSKNKHHVHVTPTKKASFTSTTVSVPILQLVSPKQFDSYSTEDVEGKSTKNSKFGGNKKNNMTSPGDNCKSKFHKISVTGDNVESPFGTMSLIQKLVKHEEFPERLARNINDARNESPHKRSASEELESTIAKVTNETMNDPLCKNIIAEILDMVDENNAMQDNTGNTTDKNGETLILEDTEKNEIVSRTYDRNSRYPEMHEFINFNSERPANINIPIESEITGDERDYVIQDEINVGHSNSIHTYQLLLNPNNENGNVTCYPKGNESFIQLHGIGDSNSYLIGQNVPIIPPNKETKRRKFQPLGTWQPKKPVPIAPKPTIIQVAEAQERSRSQLGSKASKKTKK